MATTLTRGNLITALRTRLNDPTAGGNYTDAQLDVFLNSAVRRVELETKCHLSTQTLSVSADDDTVDCAPVFDVQSVIANGIPLKRKTIPELELIRPNWDVATSGIPTEYVPFTGSIIKLSPPPNATAAAYTWKATGPTQADDELDSDDDLVDTIPEAYGWEALLDEAESQARRARPRQAGNLALSALLAQSAVRWRRLLANSIASKP